MRNQGSLDGRECLFSCDVVDGGGGGCAQHPAAQLVLVGAAQDPVTDVLWNCDLASLEEGEYRMGQALGLSFGSPFCQPLGLGLLELLAEVPGTSGGGHECPPTSAGVGRQPGEHDVIVEDGLCRADGLQRLGQAGEGLIDVRIV